MRRLRHPFARLRRGATLVRFTEPASLGDVPVADGFDAGRLLALTQPRFSALAYPDTGPARDAQLPGDEPVFGVTVGEEARMYPTSLLRAHHVVNDRVGGLPITVAFCARCFSGVAFDPVLENLMLTFQIYGLYQGTIALVDDQTGTIWTPFTAQGLAGQLAGRRLQVHPLIMSTFQEWTTSYPESTTAHVGAGQVRGAGRPPGAPANDGVLPKLVSRWDSRLPPRTFVLGVEAGSRARVYVLDERRAQPVAFDDVLGDVPLVIMGARNEWPLAYDRRIGLDRRLEFRVEGGVISDSSGSVWRAGEAIAGPLTGLRLPFVRSHVTEWYTWAAFYPESEIRVLIA